MFFSPFEGPIPPSIVHIGWHGGCTQFNIPGESAESKPYGR